MGFENNFNGITFYYHFCVKTGVKCPEEFSCYSLALETYCAIHVLCTYVRVANVVADHDDLLTQ